MGSSFVCAIWKKKEGLCGATGSVCWMKYPSGWLGLFGGSWMYLLSPSFSCGPHCPPNFQPWGLHLSILPSSQAALAFTAQEVGVKGTLLLRDRTLFIMLIVLLALCTTCRILLFSCILHRLPFCLWLVIYMTRSSLLPPLNASCASPMLKLKPVFVPRGA